MNKKMLWMVIVSFLIGNDLRAQNLAGDWQGTLQTSTQPLRILLHVSKGDGGSWKAVQESIDQVGFGQGRPASSIMLKDSIVAIAYDEIGAKYHGRLSADGNSITGMWTQAAGPLQLNFRRATKETAWRDPSPHSIRFIAVDKDVRLEVLDWGGSGRPVVFLSGLGNTGHIFDQFAPKLTSKYHVYGITRRGFGSSSIPATGYTADRLADDVLAVADSLGLNRPVLVGHSIAGEELSSVGSRHPEKVSGLVYLDAGYPYAYYDSARGDMQISLNELHVKLERLQATRFSDPTEFGRVIAQLLDADLPAFERSLRDFQKGMPPAPAKPAPSQQPPPRMSAVTQAILKGQQKYTEIRTPVLAIYAYPHGMPPAIANDSTARTAFLAAESSRVGVQAQAFERGVPAARVIRLPNADHYVFKSNEADVLREIQAFVDKLR
jgi:non-heme chloroperoxidase